MVITRISEFTAAVGKTTELHALLQSLVPYISAAPGCLGCEVLRQQEDEHCFVVVERWENIESHKKCLQNFPAEGMENAMALLARPPTGHYYSGG